MRTSEQVSEIQAALSAMQGELQPALKDKDNPYFKSRYADFLSCKSVAQEVMAKNGLAAIQGILSEPDKGWIGIETRITHKSGQWIESDSWCKPKALLPQDVGSAVTYLKRYALSAMLGIVADDDDDANQAQGKNDEPKKETYQKPVEQPKKIEPKKEPAANPFYTGTPQERKHVVSVLAKHGVPEQDYELIHEEMINKNKNILFDVILKRYEP